MGPVEETARGAARVRAIAFLVAIDDGCAESLAACPGGHAVLDGRHPALWSANHLRVETLDAPDPAALAAAAEEHLGALAFRMIAVFDEAVARTLSASLAEHGYRAAHELLMLAGPAPAAAPGAPAAVVEVAHEDLTASRVAAQVELGRAAEVGRQLASRDARIGTVVAIRRFALVAGGEIAARCQVYAGGDVAQIENLYVAPAHRGRGLARVVGEHALRAAWAGGARLVFGIAAADDWPQSFYRRAGFAGAGLLPRFLRTEERTPS
jgi:GNAT superfamily N-acetyltransferase